ncbi:hypothetical protein NIES2101_34760 [Calothrix sp. HK-06]|nr:hypothetical protein NIES2101_34760 [Calothrix sp. HK-06]
MPKTSSRYPARVLRIKPIGLILPQSSNDSNSTNKQCQIFSLIKLRRRKDALELLESRGYYDDVAIFLINCLQLEVVL